MVMMKAIDSRSCWQLALGLSFCLCGQALASGMPAFDGSPAIVMPDAAKYSVPAPVPAAGRQPYTGAAADPDDAIKFARGLLDKSLQRQAEYPYPKFWKEVTELRAAFDNKFVIKHDNCGRENTVMYTLKSEYYLDQSSSRKKNIIHICKGYRPGIELMAQDFLHETSHVALVTMETDATELEMMVTALGGGYPVMNGYVGYNEDLSQSELEDLGWTYLRPALGITSKLSYDYQQLRGAVVYDDYALFVKGMTLFKDRHSQLLGFTDFKGYTLAGIICSLPRQRFADYLAAEFPGDFHGCPGTAGKH